MHDIGDAIELTFTTNPGAVVSVTVTSPSGAKPHDQVPVPESTTRPGDFSFTFQLTEPDIWEARFTASGTATQVETFHVRALPVTGPPPLATVGEVEELLGRLITSQPEHTLTVGLLRRASAMIRGRWLNLADRVAAGTVDADAPSHAVVNMVLRVLRNPEGLRAKTVGPFSYTYDVAQAAGLLVVTDTETDLIEAPAQAKAAAANPVGSVIGTPSLLGHDPWSAPRNGWPRCLT